MLELISSSKKILFVFTIPIFLLFSASIAKACLCSTPTDVLRASEDSKNMGIFQIQSVEKYAEGEKGYGYNGYKQAILKVQKVYKGNLKDGDTFAFKQGGNGDCVLTFNERLVGKEMLLYLGDKPQKNQLWEILICSRSQFKEFAVADLLYLENKEKLQNKTRISGTLTKRIRPSMKGESGSMETLAGINVNIRGEGKNINLKTDKNGVYEIYELPSGKYIVTPEKINGFKFSVNKISEEIELGEEDHEGQDFDFEVDNRISGKVYDSNGNPFSSVCLEMFPVRGEKPKSYDLYECVDDDGNFEFIEIPPGNYILVITNKSEKTNTNAAFEKFYYPNVFKLEEAGQIAVEAGTFFNNLNIKVPKFN